MPGALSGHTTPFAVLGHPIGHSLSPVMHNASIDALGMDAVYLAFDVHPDRLLSVLPAMRDMGFGGVNLTVPLKEVAFQGMDDLADSARQLGAVNTIEFLDHGGLRGHNTDGYGFLQALRTAFHQEVTNRAVFLVGAGGAGRAVAITCAVEGAREIRVADVDATRAARVAREIGAVNPRVAAEAVDATPGAWTRCAAGADLVVQATPVGMRPGEPSVLDAAAFHPGQMAFDLIYMYPETPFTRAAGDGGAQAVNGLDMLLFQGARSFTIWTGRDPDIAAMREALQRAVYRKGDAESQ